MIFYKNTCSDINWNEVASIFLKAPLGIREPCKLKKAFENSYTKIFAFDDKKLIGCGRAISDGEYQAAIYDVVLLPEYQKKGIGKIIMNKLTTNLPVDNIILYAVPTKESFYTKCGFKKMKTAMAKLNKRMSESSIGYLYE